MSELSQTTTNRVMSPTDERPALGEGARTADVVIVGAGMTGLATAIMLLDAGRSVIVLEQQRPGALASGHNTGKATVLQGDRIAQIRKHHSARLTRAYVDANRSARDWIEWFCASADVPFRLTTDHSYAQRMTGLDAVDELFSATQEAGLPTRRIDRPEEDVPFPFAGGVALDGQVAFEPTDFVDGLVREVERRGGRIVSGVRALGVRASAPVRVRTSAGEFFGDRVLIATGAPILDRGLYWAKTSAFRSMIVSFAPVERMPDGLYISVDEPKWSIRSMRFGADDRLIVCGGDHPVGRGPGTNEALDEIVGFATSHWPDARDAEHWAAQDYRPHNEIPFSGRLPRGRGRVWTSTGYAKWGLTNSIAAAMRVSAEIADQRRPAWADVTGRRLTVPADVLKGALEGAKVGASMVRGWVAALGSESYEGTSTTAAMPEGDGAVLRRGIRPVAVSKVEGEICAVSGICPHLGGVLAWNAAETTWDCPLHASRFDRFGRRIEGPAVTDLQRISSTRTIESNVDLEPAVG